MYEDRPERDTPEWIREELREYGGLSPDGQTIWRLVRAENCRIHCFGRLNHIVKEKVAKLGDTDHPVNITPDRIEEGEFWIPRYAAKGWILQRWFPASVWGTKEKWEGERAQDGRTRLMASYPQRGDYMMMPCGPWRTVTEIGDIKRAIRSYNAQQRANPVNWLNLQTSLAAFEGLERQRAADVYAEELESEYRIGFSSALRTVSSAAQKVRNTIADYSAGGVNLG